MIHYFSRKLITESIFFPLRGGAYAHSPNSKGKEVPCVSVASVRLRLAPQKKAAEALTLMLMFGEFILSFIGVMIVIVQAIVNAKKDRQ